MPEPIAFDNTFTALPERFFSPQVAQPVARPELICINDTLAKNLGIDCAWLHSEAGLAALSGNAFPPGAAAVATVYAGHQFGGFNPQLGDGRAVLLGEILDPRGQRYDLQLKGSGPTPYSRGGDGRSPLGPVLREYLVSEAMHTLGVPTSRALAAISSGEQVYRDRVLPGAILTRVASSHIRIGHFEYFASRGDHEALSLLCDYVIARHYPQQKEHDKAALALLEAVVSAQARLLAHWQLLGFIHGVMNTDNMLVCGETIDYGPCAFMDAFDPDTVFSSIDHSGRYAYRQQPGIAHWNLSILAQCLLPLLDSDQDRALELAQSAVDRFPADFQAAHKTGLAHKLGLFETRSEDQALIQDLFTLMAETAVDFTLFFRQLADLADSAGQADKITDHSRLPARLLPWLQRWQARIADESVSAHTRQSSMYKANPAYIPRNHLVEEALQAANNAADFSVFEALLARLQRPFDFEARDLRFALPPKPGEAVYQTFCGT